jgi:hypothetical protein
MGVRMDSFAALRTLKRCENVFAQMRSGLFRNECMKTGAPPGESERARVLKASALVVMMTLVGTFFASCLRGVEKKNSIANEWALASGRLKKVATESGSHQFNKCCGVVFALLVNAFGAGVANLVQGFFGARVVVDAFCRWLRRIGRGFRKFSPIKRGSFDQLKLGFLSQLGSLLFKRKWKELG